MPASRRVAPLARWAVVVVVALMGAALLITAWTTYAGVRDASETLARGQAGTFQQAIRTRLFEHDGDPDAATLAALLEDHGGEGLRFVAVIDPPGGLLVQAGESIAGDALPERLMAGMPETPVRVGDRVRMFFRASQRRGPAAEKGQRGGRRGYVVVMELEPLQAERLRTAAAGTLRVGSLAAGTLLVIAALLVRWVLRREASELELERARRLASLGQLSAVLAHEIRNPLASLKGNAQLLAQSLPEGEKSRAKADRVVDEAIRLEHLTNDLLEFARHGELRRGELEPAALLRESVAAVAPAQIEIDDQAAPRAWSLDGDRMRQVLTNLLENAVQAGAPVRASVAARDGRLVFEVADSGAGVPDEDLERIFEPFYTRRTHGTGLGLAVVKRVVELHDGEISVTNAPGGGAIFRVALPRG